MNCIKCGSPLEDNAIFCENCGNQFAVNEQKENVANALSRTKNLIIKWVNSPVFLIISILFTINFATYAIYVFQGGTDLASALLPLIFMLISMIGLWRSYSAKSAANLNKTLRQASIYDAYQRVMYTIGIVLLCIFGVLTLVLLFACGDLIENMIAQSSGDQELAAAFTNGKTTITIIVFITFAISIAIVSAIRAIFKNRRKYFLDLAQASSAGKYIIKKAPVFGSWFIGICTLLGIIGPIALLGSSEAVREALNQFLVQFEENGYGEIVTIVTSSFEGMMSSLAVSIINSLVVGVYYILTAIWIANVHKAEVKNNVAIATESEKLRKLEFETHAAIIEIERKKKKAIEEEKEKAANNEKKLQEQQQQMMQMMMMQMMQKMQENGISMPNMDETSSLKVANEEVVNEVKPAEGESSFIETMEIEEELTNEGFGSEKDSPVDEEEIVNN